MKLNIAFSKAMCYIRVKNGETQEQLSFATRIIPSNYESEYRQPGFDIFDRFCDHYKLNAERLSRLIKLAAKADLSIEQLIEQDWDKLTTA